MQIKSPHLIQHKKMYLQIVKFFKDLTVEPALFVYYATYVLLELLSTNLYLQKACRHPSFYEPDLDTKCDNEKVGVQFISEVNSKYRFITVMLILVYSTLATCWSDEMGRKRKQLIVLPIVGQLFQASFGLLHSYNWHWSPSYAVATDLLCQLFSGGHLMLIFLSYIYVCDTSTVENRTMRIGILTAIKTISIPFGNGSAGWLMHAFGFFNTYLLCLALTGVALALALVLVRDISVPIEKKVTIWSVFSSKQLVECFRVLFKKRLGDKRKIIAVLLCVHILVWFTSEGEKTVLYLYLRYLFGWNERMYSLYLTYKIIGVIIGTFFCSIFLSKILKVHDGIIGAFAGFWDTLAVAAYMLATENWQLYLIPILDIFHGVASAIYFSFMSKFYDSAEFGRLSSALNIFSLLIPLCNPAYNIVFQKTMDYFPSAYFLISLVLDIVICILYIIAYILSKKLDV